MLLCAPPSLYFIHTDLAARKLVLASELMGSQYRSEGKSTVLEKRDGFSLFHAREMDIKDILAEDLKILFVISRNRMYQDSDFRRETKNNQQHN